MEIKKTKQEMLEEEKENYEFRKALITNVTKIADSLEKISLAENGIINTPLDVYKKLRSARIEYTFAFKFVAYCSVDAYLMNASEEEYEILSSKCVDAYLHSDDCDLSKLSDIICEKYSSNKFDLNELKEMDKYEILNIYGSNI